MGHDLFDDHWSWQVSIDDSRAQIEGIFEQSPSLKRFAGKSVADIYARARRQASIQTRMPLSVFPSECPYSFAQILNADFLPQN